MRRKLDVISYRGIGLNTTGKSSHLLFEDRSFDPPEHEPVLLGRINAFPSRIRTQPKEKTFVVRVTFISIDTEGHARELGRIFDPTLGTQYLVVRDSDGIDKRVLCEPRRIIAEGESGREWSVPLVAARPLLESEAVKTSDNDAVSAGVTFSVNNAGSYNAEVLLEVTPITLKTARQGYCQMREITYAWRSELPATGPGSGTWLLQLIDNWNTSALIRVAGATTSCTTTISAAQTMPFTIAVTSTALFDSEGMLLVEPGGGNEEQFEYVKLTGTTIQLTARALGGTLAALHTQPFTVQMSRLQKDGRDIAVFVDEQKLPDERVNLVSVDTTDTEVWVEISDTRHFAVLVNGEGGTAFAAEFNEHSLIEDDTVFVLSERDHGFVVGDYLVFDQGGGVFEMVRVLSIDTEDPTFVAVSRHVRNSPLQAHAPIELDIPGGFRLYQANHHIQLAYNYSQATERRANPNPPLIDLALSTNALWQWDGPPFWPDDNRRPGGWRRTMYDGAVAAASRLNAMTSLDAAGGATFTDGLPTAAKPNFDAIEFFAACGIATTNGVEFTASLGFPFSLQVIGRDFLGYESLVASRHGHESGSGHHFPVVYTGLQLSPTQALASVLLRARNCIVTGAKMADTFGENLEPALTINTDAQKFTLDAFTTILGMVTRVRKQTAGSVTYNNQINESGSGGVGEVAVGVLGHTETSTVLHETCIFPAIPGPLQPGEYFLVLFEASATDLEIIRSIQPIYGRGSHYRFDGALYLRVSPPEDLWFSILSLDADNQEEMLPNAKRTGETAVVSNIILRFDTTRTPAVVAQAEEDAYYFDDEWSQGSQLLRLRYLKRWIDRATISIDTLSHDVEDEQYGDDIRQALFAETEDFLTVPPGIQEIVVVANAVREQHTLNFRDTWAS